MTFAVTEQYVTTRKTASAVSISAVIGVTVAVRQMEPFRIILSPCVDCVQMLPYVRKQS